MLSRRDILKVSAVSAAAAGMIGGVAKNAAADDHRNIVPPAAISRLLMRSISISTNSPTARNAVCPAAGRARPPSSSFRSPKVWQAST